MVTAQPACCTDLAPLLRPDLFRALCDPRRLEVLERLATAEGALTVSQVGSCCGVHLSGVSRHLALLKQAGVVDAERRGREVTYRVEFEHLIDSLRSLADALERCRDAQLEGNDELLGNDGAHAPKGTDA